MYIVSLNIDAVLSHGINITDQLDVVVSFCI